MNAGSKAKMTKFVVDAYAWIEYLKGSEKGRRVAEIIENDLNEVFTSAATVSEIVSKSMRENKEANIALSHINNLSIVINLTQDISIAAGELHFETKKVNKEFGMLDSFVAATARKINAKILTGDEDFKNFKNALFI